MELNSTRDALQIPFDLEVKPGGVLFCERPIPLPTNEFNGWVWVDRGAGPQRFFFRKVAGGYRLTC
jgi:hypothetical protein